MFQGFESSKLSGRHRGLRLVLLFLPPMRKLFEQHGAPSHTTPEIRRSATGDTEQPVPKGVSVTERFDVPSNAKVNLLHDICRVIGRSQPRDDIAHQGQVVMPMELTP